MSHSSRQLIAVFATILFLLIASAHVWQAASPRNRIEIPIDAVAASAAATSYAGISGVELIKPVVEIYQTSSLKLEPGLATSPVIPKKKAEVKTAASKAMPQSRPEKTPAAREQPKLRQSNSSTATTTATAPRDPSGVASVQRGERPGLIVDYAAIGFARYALLTERAGGVFFSYREVEGVGPRLSFVQSRVVPNGVTTDLELERPYLVSDFGVAEWLATLDLPEGVSRTSVVVLWPKRLDRAVWDSITAAVADSGLRLKDVQRIEATVREGRHGLDLLLDALGMREGDQRVSIKVPRTVRIAP